MVLVVLRSGCYLMHLAQVHGSRHPFPIVFFPSLTSPPSTIASSRPPIVFTIHSITVRSPPLPFLLRQILGHEAIVCMPLHLESRPPYMVDAREQSMKAFTTVAKKVEHQVVPTEQRKGRAFERGSANTLRLADASAEFLADRRDLPHLCMKLD
ncbi:hypothetical protein ZIOFF_003526 [Zingiber officinale]|uniref:Uncharacterized protein n=1 Tax=Zingiber officinale TaxID=94328 RepID=A0A8J5IDG0_ZINOF|nr:hypothetical protein ZIOFF_003526 [Zingiber officinale]